MKDATLEGNPTQRRCGTSKKPCKPPTLLRSAGPNPWNKHQPYTPLTLTLIVKWV